MNVQKFYASTTREALRKVRDTLGESALILSNKAVAGGIEILAVAEADVEALTTLNRPAGGPEAGAGGEVTNRVAQTRQGIAAKAPATPRLKPHFQLAPDFSEKVAQAYHQVAEYTQDADSIEDGFSDRSEIHFFTKMQSPVPPSVRPAPYPLGRKVSPSISSTGGAAYDQVIQKTTSYNENSSSRLNQEYKSNEGAPEGILSTSQPPAADYEQILELVQEKVLKREKQEQKNRLKKDPERLEPTYLRTGNFAAHDQVLSKRSAELADSFEREAAAISLPVAQQISREIWSLRTLLEGQLAGIAWREVTRQDPQRALLLRTLLSVGFSPQLSRIWLDLVPSAADLSQAIKHIKHILHKQLICLGPQEDIIDHGGVYALVGPTGVGKTTTVAKLAARCTLKYGPQRVALITTDSYRIGAHDQLKIYGQILGVPVYAIRNEEDLNLTLSDLASRSLILVDTVGMGQRDRRLIEQAAIFGEHRGGAVQQLLLLNANVQSATLEDVLRVYTTQALAGCILTKVDEAVQLGGVLDTIVRYELPLYYVTNGQRVPEDLHLANPLYLIDRAFRSGLNESPWALLDEEYPLHWQSGSSTAGQQPTEHETVVEQRGSR